MYFDSSRFQERIRDIFRGFPGQRTEYKHYLSTKIGAKTMGLNLIHWVVAAITTVFWCLMQSNGVFSKKSRN